MIWVNGDIVRPSISGAGMETDLRGPLVDVLEKYRHWNDVLHDMYVLNPEEDLRHSVPARPIVLVLGSARQLQNLLHSWLNAVSFPENSTEIIHIYPKDPEELPDQVFDPEVSSLSLQVFSGVQALPCPDWVGIPADFYLVSDLSSLPSEAIQCLKKIAAKAQILINLDVQSAQLKHSLGLQEADTGPLLYLEESSLAVSPQPERTQPVFGSQIIRFDSVDNAVTYLHKLSQLWPCFLAQLLERQLQSLMRETIPHLMRWRRRWMFSVAFLDVVVIAAVVWGMTQWGWWQALLQITWSTLPILIATATFFVAVFLLLMSILLLWRIHKGTCALCSMTALSCLGSAGAARRNPFRRAFLENTRSFWQTVSCRDLCGWSSAQRDDAVTFCQYCQDLKSQFLTRDPTS